MTQARPNKAKSKKFSLVRCLRTVGHIGILASGRDTDASFSARRTLVSIAVDRASVVAWAVSVVISNAGAYGCTGVNRTVIIRWITVTVARRVVSGRVIVPSVICGHVRSLGASAQGSHHACAKNRQQKCSTAALGFRFCFHDLPSFPFIEAKAWSPK
jgi:hypothetical protein